MCLKEKKLLNKNQAKTQNIAETLKHKKHKIKQQQKNSRNALNF